MSKTRSRIITPTVEKTIWGLAAGRCEFEGCNCFLGQNQITAEYGNYAEKAHIEAVSAGGARYREIMDNSELNSAENIMLLCAKCHKTIDENSDKYPVERLKKMKQEHENRVYWMTGYTDVQKSFMVGYFAQIDGVAPDYSNDLFCKALLSDKKIPVEKYIKIIGIPDIPYGDGSKDYYRAQMSAIEKDVERAIKPAIQNNENISVFALAPIPLLMKLGEKLRDISNISVFQCHRKEDKWSWDKDDISRVEYLIQNTEVRGQKKVVLNISLSADIEAARIRKCVGNMAVYKLTISEPNRNFVKNKIIMDEYVNAFRNCMEQIRSDNPEIEEIHVFSAMPNSLALRTGMDYMPKCDPKLIVYDQIRPNDAFVQAVAIGGE